MSTREHHRRNSSTHPHDLSHRKHIGLHTKVIQAMIEKDTMLHI